MSVCNLEMRKSCKLWNLCCEEYAGSGDFPPCFKELPATASNSDYTKCADEVLRAINYSRDSAHGRKIVEIIKRHFA